MSQEETPPDVQSADQEAQDGHFDENVKSRSTWLRLFFMIVVGLLYGISRVVVGAVVVLQFFWVLITGATNKQLEQLGQSLATYTYQVICYLTFNTEERPFPFDSDWPTQPPAA